ncbi:MAG: efflux RND transporter periplasmic adaptor subunit [Psychromonas sp.]
MFNNHLTYKKLRFVIPILCLVLVGCDQENPAPSSVDVIKPVKLLLLSDINAKLYDSFLANVDANNRAILSFQVSGEVDTLRVRMGESVKKGEVLSTLVPTDYQLVVDAKQAEFDLSEADFLRSQQLAKKKLISKDSFDQVETKFTQAKIALSQAQTDLTYTRLISPFDGTVSISYVKAHQVIDANQAIMNIVNNDVMDVTFTIPMSYIEKNGLNYLKNNKFSVEIDSHRGASIDAQFKEISTYPNHDTSSYTATVTINKPLHFNLLSGMTGQVKLHNAQRQKKYQVTANAWVEKSNTEGKIWRFNPETQTIHLITVTLDEFGNIVAGANQGDLIIVAGVDKLVDGQQVKAWLKESGI